VGTLLVRYDLDKLREGWSREWIPSGPTSMWRYAPVLLCRTGGDDFARRRHDAAGSHDNAWDAAWERRFVGEGRRRQSYGQFQGSRAFLRVSMCVELGVKKVAIPSAGNAAGADGRLRRGRRESKRIYSCLAMCRRRITSSAARLARTLLWSMA